MQSRTLPVETRESFPATIEPGRVYRLLPHDASDEFYYERTDRNIGWITREEQEMLRHKVVGIAGCGGMGGLLASIFCRLGVGEVRIADSETFDVSNINRQYAAGRLTIGESKAWETARLTRETVDDVTLVVYPEGIIEETVHDFVSGCDLICDEVEFWAAGSRIMLHQHARFLGVPLLNCNTVGFGTRLFLFTPGGYPIERMLGMSYEEAIAQQARIQAGTATEKEVTVLMERILDGLVPELPEYAANPSRYSTVATARARLINERRATIISTNPPLAAGFLADHALFQLLKESPIPRTYVLPPPAPGYLYFDCGQHAARVVARDGRP